MYTGTRACHCRLSLVSSTNDQKLDTFVLINPSEIPRPFNSQIVEEGDLKQVCLSHLINYEIVMRHTRRTAFAIISSRSSQKRSWKANLGIRLSRAGVV